MQLPCPRCGANEFAIDIVQTDIHNEDYHVMCRNCGQHMGTLNVNE